MHRVSCPWRSSAATTLFRGSLLLFVLLSLGIVIGGPVTRFDGIIEHVIIVNLMDVLSPLARIGGILGSSDVLLPTAVVLMLLLMWKREWMLGIACIASLVTADLLVWVMKPAFGRPRPIDVEAMEVTSKFSFPSGHATRSAVLYGFVIVLLWMLPISHRSKTNATIVLLTLILAIDAARMVAGVHYLTDVLAGNALGIVVLLLTFSLVDTVAKRINMARPHR